MSKVTYSLEGEIAYQQSAGYDEKKLRNLLVRLFKEEGGSVGEVTIEVDGQTFNFNTNLSVDEVARSVNSRAVGRKATKKTVLKSPKK